MDYSNNHLADNIETNSQNETNSQKEINTQNETGIETSTLIIEKLDKINNNFETSIFCFSLFIGLLVALCFSVGFNSTSK